MAHDCRFLSCDQPLPAHACRSFARTALRLCLLALAAASAMAAGALPRPTCSTAPVAPGARATLELGDLRLAILQAGTRVAIHQVANGARETRQRQPELTLSLQPAARDSALVTSGGAGPLMGAGRIGGLDVTVLGRSDAVLSAVAARGSEVHFAAFQQEQRERGSAESRLVTLERLYSDIFRQPPTSRFFFSGLPGAARGSGSQAVALDAIARARACILRQLPPDTHLKPLRWETASLALHAGDRRDAKRVTASVRDGNARPVSGAVVAFARGEHLACDAKTNAEGVASCQLFDVHGDGEHEPEGRTTIVTFAGAPRPRSFLLPRTLVAKSFPDRH